MGVTAAAAASASVPSASPSTRTSAHAKLTARTASALHGAARLGSPKQLTARNTGAKRACTTCALPPFVM
eukprot:7833726-Pyramimonas_sp.AAC.1